MKRIVGRAYSFASKIPCCEARFQSLNLFDNGSHGRLTAPYIGDFKPALR